MGRIESGAMTMKETVAKSLRRFSSLDDAIVLTKHQMRIHLNDFMVK